MPKTRDPEGLKAYRAGSHRTVAPEQTLERARPHLATLGITRVANITGLDRVGVPVFIAIRPNSRSVAVSQGKGVRPEDARVSAVMEALELWHAERFSGPLHYCSQRELPHGEETADLDALPRPEGNRFSPDLALLWCTGKDLSSGRELLLPYEMVHTNYTHPQPPGQGAFSSSSNGLASGNHPLEAVCHAICEVIERDALSCWDQNGPAAKEASRIDLSSIGTPSSVDILKRFEGAGLQCHLWEVTSDLEVPCFHAALFDPGDDEAHLGLGSGCHGDPEIALSRALTEAAQTRLTYISGSRDDLIAEEFSGQGREEKREQIRRLSISTGGKRAFSQQGGMSSPTFRQDLDGLLEKLQRRGYDQVIAVDLTQADIGLPVVRVVIPGLEAPHDDEDYQPGPRALSAGASEQ